MLIPIVRVKPERIRHGKVGLRANESIGDDISKHVFDHRVLHLAVLLPNLVKILDQLFESVLHSL